MKVIFLQVAGSDNPDLLYNQIIRPWKSRLALLTIEHSSLLLDIKIILLTILALISKQKALIYINTLLKKWQVEDILIRISKRNEKLIPYPPPGSNEIVSTYP